MCEKSHAAITPPQQDTVTAEDTLLALAHASQAMIKNLMEWKARIVNPYYGHAIAHRQVIDRFVEQAVPEFNRCAHEFVRLMAHPCARRLRAVHAPSIVGIGESIPLWGTCYAELLVQIVDHVCSSLPTAFTLPMIDHWLGEDLTVVADGFFRARQDGTMAWMTEMDLVKLKTLLFQEFACALNRKPTRTTPQGNGGGTQPLGRRRTPKGKRGRKPAVEKHAAVAKDVASGMSQEDVRRKYGYQDRSGVAHALARHKKRSEVEK